MTLILFGITGRRGPGRGRYNNLLNRDPEADALALRRIREAVAVILVIAQATRAVLDALQGSQRPYSTFMARHHPTFDHETEEFNS